MTSRAPRLPRAPRIPRIPRAAALLLCMSLSAAAFGQCGVSFGTSLTSAGSATRQLALADFNNDGLLDAFTLNNADFSVALGIGNGMFQAPHLTSIAPTACVSAADFDGDGVLDVALGVGSSCTIMHGAGNGTFTLLSSFGSGGTNATLCAASDIDHDGRVDLLLFHGNTRNVVYFRNLGSGSFAAGISTSTGVPATSMALGDFNGDGSADLVLVNGNSSGLGLFVGSGFGPFANSGTLGTLAFPTSVAVADFNGDGRPDLACSVLTGSQVQIFTGNGGMSFTLSSTLATASGPVVVLAPDLNTDGRPDLAVLCNSTGSISYGLNAAGTFPPLSSVAGGTGAQTLAAGNLTGDSTPELVVGFNPGTTIKTLVGSLTQAPAITTQPTTIDVLSGSPASFTVPATGGSLTYAWKRNNLPLANGGSVSGANSPTLTINPASSADHLSVYQVTVSNACGSVTSDAVALGVHDCAADFNGDGFIDFFDYLDFIGAFSSGCP